MPRREARGTADGAELPLALPAGVGVKDEPAVEERFADVHERVVQDALAERRDADLALLRVVDHEARIAADRIVDVQKPLAKPLELNVEVLGVTALVGTRPLAARRLQEGVAQIVALNHRAEYVADSFHAASLTRSCACRR